MNVQWTISTRIALYRHRNRRIVYVYAIETDVATSFGRISDCGTIDPLQFSCCRVADHI